MTENRPIVNLVGTEGAEGFTRARTLAISDEVSKMLLDETRRALVIARRRGTPDPQFFLGTASSDQELKLHSGFVTALHEVPT